MNPWETPERSARIAAAARVTLDALEALRSALTDDMPINVAMQDDTDGTLADTAELVEYLIAEHALPEDA